VGGGAKEGSKLIESFMRNLPSLAKLREKVAKYAAKGYVPGLDGRKIWVRSPHAALNSLLQGAGAVVMKKALVLLDSYLKAEKIPYMFLGNIHDEIQLSTPAEFSKRAGQLGIKAIQDAGLHFKLRCPLDGACNIGKDWSLTH
jgi:DNA polymerase I-like protein with 3'-5' exonuclease and polymerase domains